MAFDVTLLTVLVARTKPTRVIKPDSTAYPYIIA